MTSVLPVQILCANLDDSTKCVRCVVPRVWISQLEYLKSALNIGHCLLHCVLRITGKMMLDGRVLYFISASTIRQL